MACHVIMHLWSQFDRSYGGAQLLFLGFIRNLLQQHTVSIAGLLVRYVTKVSSDVTTERALASVTRLEKLELRPRFVLPLPHLFPSACWAALSEHTVALWPRHRPTATVLPCTLHVYEALYADRTSATTSHAVRTDAEIDMTRRMCPLSTWRRGEGIDYQHALGCLSPVCEREPASVVVQCGRQLLCCLGIHRGDYGQNVRVVEDADPAAGTARFHLSAGHAGPKLVAHHPPPSRIWVSLARGYYSSHGVPHDGLSGRHDVSRNQSIHHQKAIFDEVLHLIGAERTTWWCSTGC